MEIISTIIFSLALIAIIGYMAYNTFKKRGYSPAAELQAIARVKSMLYAAAPNIVTRMEQAWSEKSGPVKLAGAMYELMQLIPEKYIAEFDDAALADIIEDALSEARRLWEKNPALLGELKQLQAVGFEVPEYGEYTAEDE